MELIVQTLIVAVVVVTSTVIAAWRLMPARTKLRLLDTLNPTTTTAAGRWLTAQRKRVANDLAHGCSACSSSPTHVKKH